MSATHFNLEPGLTVVTGKAGMGKTGTLVDIGEELYRDGFGVSLYSAENPPEHFAARFGLPFDRFTVRQVSNIDDIYLAVTDRTTRVVLVDGLELIVPDPADKPDLAGRTREMVKVCGRLHNAALRRSVYVIATLLHGRATRRALTDLEYPVIEVLGSRPGGRVAP